MTNIRFIYLYRDASNYKQHGEIILSNEKQLSIEEIDTQVRAMFSDGLFFIARQVQLEERFFAVMNEDDHPWHEFVQVEATTDPTFDPIPEAKRDITQFMKELEQAHHSGWDETKVRADLIQQIEKEREALKRWLVSQSHVVKMMEKRTNHPNQHLM
jgi:Mg2+ and Co2+ transporter CorA